MVMFLFPTEEVIKQLKQERLSYDDLLLILANALDERWLEEADTESPVDWALYRLEDWR